MFCNQYNFSYLCPLIFVSEGAKINTECYLSNIMMPMLTEAQKCFKSCKRTFQKDGAPSHTSKRTQE